MLNILKFAKEDFLRSDRILATGVVSMSDIKLGDKYLFSVYPAYIFLIFIFKRWKLKYLVGVKMDVFIT